MDRSAADEFRRALTEGDEGAAGRVFAAALVDGDMAGVVDRLVVPTLADIGDDWAGGLLPLATVYLASAVCETVVTAHLTKERPAADDTRSVAIVVPEDYHILGKRIVLSVLRAAGLHVADWGHGVTHERIVLLCREHRPRTLLVSALMLPTALRVRALVEALDETMGDERPWVIAGGAPFRLDPDLATEVGADASGRTATDALRLVRQAEERLP
jgi:methanogenic corrinoid protein MtbC1